MCSLFAMQICSCEREQRPLGKKDDLHQQLQGEVSSPSDAAARVASGQKPFVHLHVQSAFSLLESALPLAKIIDLAVGDCEQGFRLGREKRKLKLFHAASLRLSREGLGKAANFDTE